nr:uncharacterized protein LOC128704097 [Cherax quadricarinatus]
MRGSITHDGNIAEKNRKSLPIEWTNIQFSKLSKFLFLLDKGDKILDSTETTVSAEIPLSLKDPNSTENMAEKKTRPTLDAQKAFLSVLTDEEFNFRSVLEVLHDHVIELVDYSIITLEEDSEGANGDVSKQDEHLLILVEICRYLEIDCHGLEDKIEKVQKKFLLTEEEKKTNFFINADSLRICRICDQLTISIVHQLLDTVQNDMDLGKFFQTKLDISLEMLRKTDGLKEALFFYMIRVLEENDKLNHIYTDKLEELLERVSKAVTDKNDRLIIKGVVSTLSEYPMNCRPAGHCLVFCVTEDRKGAQEEITKVKNVFENSLGYIVHIEKDPTRTTLLACMKELQKPKYRYYGSIIYWFMAHGTETDLKLADGKDYKREDFINEFSKLNNFRKKPKLFFMVSCRGEDTIPIKKKSGILVAVDGGLETENVTEIVKNYHNITAVYYKMDRLVASSTLPEQYSFRLPDKGSVYVDTVCRLLEQHRGDNITQVLERVCNKMHQILFSCTEKFKGEAKQACYYESTLQKTFIVPREPQGIYQQ